MKKCTVWQTKNSTLATQGREAFLERLKEINMSEYDAKMYDSFLAGVKTEVSDNFVVYNF
jgi:hypothetical protein